MYVYVYIYIVRLHIAYSKGVLHWIQYVYTIDTSMQLCAMQSLVNMHKYVTYVCILKTYIYIYIRIYRLFTYIAISSLHIYKYNIMYRLFHCMQRIQQKSGFRGYFMH